LSQQPGADAPTVYVLNGPNLNLLGSREPEVYGSQTLQDVEALCERTAHGLGLGVDFRQSNHEGQLVDWIQEAGLAVRRGAAVGAVLNAGAYTHTSIAMRDAIAGVGLPVVEVHISNVHAREAFRDHSYLSAVSTGVIVGLGANGYTYAIQALSDLRDRG
jgi:3-dehydroquinate dehydratase-2